MPKQGREDDLSIQVTTQSQADPEVNRKLKEVKEMSEIKLKEEKERDERIISRVLFYFALAVVAYMFYYAFSTLRTTSIEADKQFARTIILSISSGFLGYLIGKVPTIPRQ